MIAKLAIRFTFLPKTKPTVGNGFRPCPRKAEPSGRRVPSVSIAVPGITTTMARLSIIGTSWLGAALLCATLLLAACGGNDDAPHTTPSSGAGAAACSTRHCAPAP
ncbi:hypothetical protein BGC_22630 [Burkholderia sp. 3C]